LVEGDGGGGGNSVSAAAALVARREPAISLFVFLRRKWLIFCAWWSLLEDERSRRGGEFRARGATTAVAAHVVIAAATLIRGACVCVVLPQRKNGLRKASNRRITSKKKRFCRSGRVDRGSRKRCRAVPSLTRNKTRERKVFVCGGGPPLSEAQLTRWWHRAHSRRDYFARESARTHNTHAFTKNQTTIKNKNDETKRARGRR
jgi:hypothetical protein